MPDWYQTLLANRRDPGAFLEFTKRYLAATAAEQAEIRAAWDRTLEWTMPDPFRLTCLDEQPGTPAERVRADLLFQALGYSPSVRREAILGLAVVHNSCRFAGLDPKALFEEIAGVVGEAAGKVVLAFANRDPKDQSMEAFMLTAKEVPEGGYELHPDW